MPCPGDAKPGHAATSGSTGFATGSPHRVGDHAGGGVHCLRAAPSIVTARHTVEAVSSFGGACDPRPWSVRPGRGAARPRAGAQGEAIDPLRYLGLIACAAGDLDEAARWFGEELTRQRQFGSRAAIAVGLADAATFAAAREAWQPAVRLFARAEALLQAEAAAFSLPARDHYERAHDRTRQALGEEAHQAAAVAGRALTGEQALTEAEAVLALDRDTGADATA